MPKSVKNDEVKEEPKEEMVELSHPVQNGTMGIEGEVYEIKNGKVKVPKSKMAHAMKHIKMIGG